MEEKSEIITPVFKSKDSKVNHHSVMARPVAKLAVENIQLTVFKGANPSLISDLAKVIVRYAR